MLDLVLPVECGGCGAPGRPWCGGCAGALALGPDDPQLISPRIDPGVPVFALGRYAGPRRAAIVAVKEHGRTDLLPVLAAALGQALDRLVHWGMVGRPLRLVPAPTRGTAARRRGGDPVTRMARAAADGRAGIGVAAVLRMRAFTRDSVGLSAAGRQRNIAGRVRLRGPVTGPVVLVDDVVTTGATVAESVRVLRAGGADVAAVVAVAHA